YNSVAIAWVVAAPLEGLMVYSGFGSGACRRILAPVAWLVIPIASAALAGSAIARVPLPLILRALGTVVATSAISSGVATAASPPWLREVVAGRLRAVLHAGCDH